MIDHGIVGVVEGPWRTSWTTDDALRYAVAVGAGELAFATENSEEVPQQALPTFALALTHFTEPEQSFGDVDKAMILHAEQSLTVHRPLPVAGVIEVRRTVTDILDKGSGALVRSTVEAHDAESGEPAFTADSSVFLRGEGGFGGDRGRSAPSVVPDGEPDAVLRFTTSPNQALLYRLCGDRNRLHSDPVYAARAGFPRPILHGLCTYGITCRLLIDEFLDGDAHRLSAIRGRMTAPVFPGDELVVSAWRREPDVLFRTSTADGTVVIDHGWLV
ncbi:MAG: MaoC family dehydratase N-terminal domain-containing protein [Kutzneria sp.]|nr:MaoC family dehydratase N-terminal domain-containing protein [Kutzneria sp.]